MKFSTLKNEISNDLDIHADELSQEKSNVAIQEIQEKYLKSIYGGTNASSAGLGEIRAWTAWNNGF